jgi:hypothetical protein
MGRTALRRLPGLVSAVGVAVAATGLLRRPTGAPLQVVTPRGPSAQLAGEGLYRYDTVFTAAGNTGGTQVHRRSGRSPRAFGPKPVGADQGAIHGDVRMAGGPERPAAHRAA